MSSMSILGRMETLLSSDGMPALTLLVGSFGSHGRNRPKWPVSNVRSTMNSFCVINLGQHGDKLCTTRRKLRAVKYGDVYMEV